MKDKGLILGSTDDGIEITIEEVENWLLDMQNNKNKLAELIFNRLYFRYIRPFEFDSTDYVCKYKNGFAIMTSCCLLIETYISFTVDNFVDTNHKSERCFGYFFVTEKRFNSFAIDGLTSEDYISKNPLRGTGMPRSFYIDVRCGILHNGETRNNWRIRRDSKELLMITKENKIVNATKFLKEIKEVLIEYRHKLENSALESALWVASIRRLKFLIDKS